jgi:flagellin-like protein
MFKNLRNSKRGISEILASVIIIALVLAATALVSSLLTNVNIVDLFGYSVVPEKKVVTLSMDVQLINDTDLDSRIDTVIVYMSLDVDSPSVYIQDVDVQLPIGDTVDDIYPWSIVGTTQSWNIEFKGFTILNGNFNASFTIQLNDFTQNNAELSSGTSFSLIFYYVYLSDLGGKILTVSDYYVSSLLIAP